MNEFYKIKTHQWTLGFMLTSVFLLVSCLSQANGTNYFESSPTATPRQETSDSSGDKSNQTHYLLIFKAYPPHEKKERHFYELAQEIKGFVDPDRFPPTGIQTNETVRYGVFIARRAKIFKTTDSGQSPKSLKNGVYLLAYDRTYKICARNYLINSKKKIIYTDYQDGKKYEFPLKTSEPMAIYELEVSTENILRDLWEEKREDQ